MYGKNEQTEQIKIASTQTAQAMEESGTYYAYATRTNYKGMNLGDIDGDGFITYNDVSELYKKLQTPENAVKFSENNEENAEKWIIVGDINGDNQINGIDAVRLTAILKEMIDDENIQEYAYYPIKINEQIMIQAAVYKNGYKTQDLTEGVTFTYNGNASDVNIVSQGNGKIIFSANKVGEYKIYVNDTEAITIIVDEDVGAYSYRTVNYAQSLGDVDGDGFITYHDVLLVKDKARGLGQATLSENDWIRVADFNQDGKINAIDFIQTKAAVKGKLNYKISTLQPYKVKIGDEIIFNAISSEGGKTIFENASSSDSEGLEVTKINNEQFKVKALRTGTYTVKLDGKDAITIVVSDEETTAINVTINNTLVQPNNYRNPYYYNGQVNITTDIPMSIDEIIDDGSEENVEYDETEYSINTEGEYVISAVGGSGTRAVWIRIDKTAPSNTAPSATSTTNSITITNNQNDASGLMSVQYGILIDGTWKWQYDGEFTDLQPNTEYQVKTKATDKAGNEIESNITTISTKREEPKVFTITLNGDNPMELEVGDSYVEPGAEAKDEYGNSYNIQVSGTIDTGKIGTYTIKYTVRDNNGNIKKEVNRTINVVARKDQVSGITLDTNQLELKVGEKDKLNATVEPETALNKKVKWESSDETVATVDEKGYITAVKKGTATITATTIDGGFKAKCTVIVTEAQSNELIFTSDVYYILNREKNILNVSPNTTLESFKKNITSNVTYKVVTTQAKEILSTDIVGTGMKVVLNNNEKTEYTIIVKGDINGDGLVTLTDLAKLKKSLVNLVELTNIELKGADFDLDGTVSLTDLSKMTKYLIGLE